MKNLIKKIFGFCPKHGWFKYPKRFRTNTRYVKDEDNYIVGCKHCKEEADEYYGDLWDTFYSGH